MEQIVGDFLYVENWRRENLYREKITWAVDGWCHTIISAANYAFAVHVLRWDFLNWAWVIASTPIGRGLLGFCFYHNHTLQA